MVLARVSKRSKVSSSSRTDTLLPLLCIVFSVFSLRCEAYQMGWRCGIGTLMHLGPGDITTFGATALLPKRPRFPLNCPVPCASSRVGGSLLVSASDSVDPSA
jgi:hypothetical protein